MRSSESTWTPPVLTCSGREGSGLDEIWERLERHRSLLESTGELAAKRRDQQVEWVWAMVREDLLGRLQRDPEVRRLAPQLEGRVREGSLTATRAAQRIVEAFGLA
jgi:LAO/AO transport system kinase